MMFDTLNELDRDCIRLASEVQFPGDDVVCCFSDGSAFRVTEPVTCVVLHSMTIEAATPTGDVVLLKQPPLECYLNLTDVDLCPVWPNVLITSGGAAFSLSCDVAADFFKLCKLLKLESATLPGNF